MAGESIDILIPRFFPERCTYQDNCRQSDVLRFCVCRITEKTDSLFMAVPE